MEIYKIIFRNEKKLAKVKKLGKEIQMLIHLGIGKLQVGEMKKKKLDGKFFL